MSRAAPQAGYLLHQWPWSESSLILEVFTRGRGRLALVAKGAKRPYSQLRAVLVPFQRVLFSAGRGQADGDAEILTLRSAEYAACGVVLPPQRLMAGFYLNELLLKLLARGDPHERLFDAYADTLVALSGEPEEFALRAFELVLLREIGVLPELDRETSTQADLRPGLAYGLDAEAGLRPAPADEPGVLQAHEARALEQALSALPGSATVTGPLSELRSRCRQTPAALRHLLRPVLHYHLGSPRLRTRALMLDVRRLMDDRRMSSTLAASQRS